MLVGGFEVITSGTYDDPETAAAAAIASGSPVVVLCSTDETYPTLASVFVHAIKAKSPKTIVVLAGLPADAATIATFRTAGFDEFIHVRANAESILASFLNTIRAAL
jgi:methylmalonyl-CoA mutase